MLHKIKKLLGHIILKDILRTTFWSTAGKAIGFLVPFFIAFWFGATRELDAFFVVYGIIIFLATILSNTLSTVMVPFLVEARAREQDTAAFTISVIRYMSLLVLVSVLLANVLLRPLISIFTPYNPQLQGLMQRLLLQMSVLVWLLALSGIFDGVLNASKKFTVPALTPGLRALCQILIIFACHRSLKLYAIGLGYLGGEILRVGILFFTVQRYKLMHRKVKKPLSRDVFSFIKKASFQIASLILVSLNSLIDKTMATWLPAGNVSLFYFGERLYLIPVNLAITGLMVILLSHWSETYYAGNPQYLGSQVKKAVKLCALIALPVIGLLIFSVSCIVELLFSPESFSPEKQRLIRLVFLAYLPGLLPYILTQIYARGLMVLKHTRPFFFCGLIMCTTNILFNFLLMNPCGAPGLAFSSSLVNTFSWFFLALSFKKKYRGINPPSG